MNEPGGEPGARLFRSATEWLRGEGDSADIVMSSRVRLARNLAGFPFVARAGKTHPKHILEIAKSRIMSGQLAPKMMWVDLHETSAIERTLLVERHLISQQLARGKQIDGTGGPELARAVAVSLPDERLSIMINEEDHLRVQVIRSGLALSAALGEIDEVDDKLEAGLDYAYSPRFGYLTACPTNVGTGIRFSTMLHLPALRLTGSIEKVKRAAKDMSLAVRGFYGEGSEAAGDFYQISNQSTLGRTEQVILHSLEREIIPQVVEYERRARTLLVTKRRATLEDQVFRAYGLLTNARLLATEECMQLLSHLRMGVVLGTIPGVEHRTVNELMLLTQPAHLQRVVGRDMDQEQRRAARAELVRTRLGVRAT